jgi:type 1 fimbria pilin
MEFIMQFKKLSLAAGVFGSLLATAFTVHAAGTSATMTISGIVTPSACSIALTGGGTLDFGPVHVDVLPSSGTYTMTPKTIDTVVDCQDTEQAVAISFVDNRKDSVATHSDEGTDANTAFGLGTADSKNIGSYGIKISQVTAESTAGSLLSSTGKAMTDAWGALSSDTFINNGTTPQYITYTDTSGTAPVAKKNYTFTLQVTPSVSSDMKAITSTAEFDGNTTINIDYM